MSLQASNRLASTELPSAGGATDFERELVALIPFLRGLSGVMCGKRAIAEDMAQEALTKAWRSRDSFEPGTNIKAWLFTILRNAIYSNSRRAWRELQWDETLGEKIPAPPREQEWALELSDAARALSMLKLEQRRTHGSLLPFTAKQATRWLGAVSIMSGTRRLQTSIASGQRG